MERQTGRVRLAPVQAIHPAQPGCPPVATSFWHSKSGQALRQRVAVVPSVPPRTPVSGARLRTVSFANTSFLAFFFMDVSLVAPGTAPACAFYSILKSCL